MILHVFLTLRCKLACVNLATISPELSYWQPPKFSVVKTSGIFWRERFKLKSKHTIVIFSRGVDGYFEESKLPLISLCELMQTKGSIFNNCDIRIGLREIKGDSN